MSFLDLENVHAGYGPVKALRGISLSVPEGAIVTLLGANGAGKSTTLKCISGVVPLQSGSIRLEGQPISGLSPNQIVGRGIMQVPEGRKVFKDLTVLENLMMGAYSRRDRAAIGRDLDQVYRLFPRLKERSSQLGGSLSGGEQQMLAIGRGLMGRPRVLLLDEPSLGLAPLIVASIFETLRKLNAEAGMTMLVVEQNMHVALKTASYGYVMQVGSISLEGDADMLRNSKETFDSYLGTAH
jgi:branched-chain amino acid transport system ATP-binding protein